MITIQTQLQVAGLRGGEVTDFLLNCSTKQYRAWWPGTHLEFHTRERCAGNIGNIVYMDEFIGTQRVKMTGIVCAFEPGKRLAWRLRRVIDLPVWLTLYLADESAGVVITHRITAGYNGIGRLLDPIFRLYFSPEFERAMDEHVKTEFPLLRDLLRGSKSSAPGQAAGWIDGDQ